MLGAVEGQPLDEVFEDLLPSGVRPVLLRQIGEFLAKLHVAGHPQTPRLSDLICKNPEAARRGVLQVAIIDLDLKGRPARLAQRKPSDFVNALARAAYTFLRGRHRLASQFEMRMFFRGYNRELRQHGVRLPKGYLRTIVARVNHHLEKHSSDPRLSRLVPNMPKSLDEILTKARPPVTGRKI